MADYELLTVKDAAAMLGITTTTLRNWDKSGKLKPIRHPINNYRMYRLADIVSILHENQIENNSVMEKSGQYSSNSSEKTPSDKKKLRILVRQMSKAFRDSEGGGLLDRFEEISKLLFCKMYDELELRETRKNTSDFFVRPNDSIDTVYSRIEKIFRRACEEYPGVFINGREKLTSDRVAIFEVCKILQDLELMKIPVDIKGTIYEEIIRNTFEKNENQQFFTPRVIVEFLVQMLDPKPEEVVCDPACGSGGFLIYTMMWIKDRYFLNNPDFLNEYYKEKILGVEIDSRMVWVSMMNLLMHGGSSNVIKYIPKGGSLTISKETEKILKNNSIDIIITNPPFGSDFSDKSSLNKYIVGRNKVSRRRGILFVERSLQLLKPGGKLGIILDDSVLNGSLNSDIRELIFKEAIVEAIISLPEVTFMPYSSAKSSIVILRKKDSENERFLQNDIFMANIENVGHKPNGEPLYSDERDETGKLIPLNDLPKVIEIWNHYKKGNKSKILSNSPFVFLCSSGEFFNNNWKIYQNRLDLQYHHPAKQIAKDALAKSIYPTPTLAELAFERTNNVLPKIESPDEQCRFIGLANISPYAGDYYITELLGEHIKSTVHLFKGGDILFSKLRPELRKCVFIEDQELDGYTSSENIVIRALDRAVYDLEFKGQIKNRRIKYDIDSEYLAIMLRSDIVFGQLVYQITGVGRPRISKSTFFSLKIPLPPLDEQKALVSYFKDFNKKASILKRQSHLTLIEADKMMKDAYNQIQNKLCPF